MQSLSPKIDELIALIQIGHFDFIELNETWLDIQNKHLLAEVVIHGHKVFHEDKSTPIGSGGGSIMYVKNTMNTIKKAAVLLLVALWLVGLEFSQRLPLCML